MLPYLDPNISYFAKTNFRTHRKLFGLYQKDRLLHTLLLGKTGAGKTNLVISIALQDIFHKRGCAIFDAHGDMLEILKAHIPQERMKDVIHLDIANPNLHYRYNPLKNVPDEKKSLVVGGLLDTFNKLWKGAWGIKLEHILRYILLALLERRNSTLADIPRFISDAALRNECLATTSNDEVKNFIQSEYPKYSKNDVISVQNKVGSFLSHRALKRFLVTNSQEISFRQCMDTSKIVLVDISKGKLGTDASYLIGSILLTSIAHAAFSRIDTPEEKRVPFHLFLDEFHNYTTSSVSEMLSELRKFKVSLTVAHQYLNQLDADIKNAVLGNIGSMVLFRLGHEDARYFAKMCEPVFEASDFTNLENYDIYLKLLIDGKPSRPFSATTMPWTSFL